jgi:hypothetical protein
MMEQITKKINDILNGWANYAMPKNQEVLEIAKSRAEICVGCDYIKYGLHAAILPDYSLKKTQGAYCGDCLCPISTAVRSKNYKCPKNKW